MFFTLGKDMDVKIWQLIKKVTGNSIVFASVFPARGQLMNKISNKPTARLSERLYCNWVILLVTMATPISSHVKDNNSIFTARGEDIIF